MADIFTYVPSRGFSRTSKPTVNTVKFGSGYSQRVAYGINNLDDSWDLQFTNQPLSAANNILDFLASKGGIEYFLFKPPGEAEFFKVICEDWSTEYTSHISRSINATFKRVYDLT
jgi:phage-related protein